MTITNTPIFELEPRVMSVEPALDLGRVVLATRDVGELNPEADERRVEPGKFEIPAELRNVLIDRLVREDNVESEVAPVVLNNTLLFLRALAEHADVVLTPSKLVDKAWHQFILHTREYSEYCDRSAGRFIHHEPTAPGQETVGSALSTFKFLDKEGYEPDPVAWNTNANCDGGCDGGGNCSGSCDGGCDGR